MSEFRITLVPKLIIDFVIVLSVPPREFDHADCDNAGAGKQFLLLSQIELKIDVKTMMLL